MWMSWLPDSDIKLAFYVQFRFLVPILATASVENFPLAAIQLSQIVQRAYLLCPANHTDKLFRNHLDNYHVGIAR